MENSKEPSSLYKDIPLPTNAQQQPQIVTKTHMSTISRLPTSWRSRHRHRRLRRKTTCPLMCKR